MTSIFTTRCDQLLGEFTRFRRKVLRLHPKLIKGKTFHFVLTISKDKSTVMQYLGVEQELKVTGVKTNTSLHKKLGYLASRKMLEYAEHSNNPNQFSIELNCTKLGKSSQLALII